ncbi:hypothetical protein DAPPUDRAFT_241241 [Daphnia pulex]|uniref:Ionotropic glutamate receptor C-terminal domain-containing protein n=1 Tax=Daphnia pulex TaxID=6669 RepID=E9GDS7_DAPPU|nr:hypothetical protein DAPPUDRAFT_241241 [Daphnia pulex]|eukprot:EFX82428.1 hypothetical protein DAPPUDRAFT_241241 [Daphnia pulex]
MSTDDVIELSLYLKPTESPEPGTPKHHIRCAPPPSENVFLTLLFPVVDHYFDLWFLVDAEFSQWSPPSRHLDFLEKITSPGHPLQPRWSGNPKGLSGPLKGGVVLDYLSNRLNFTQLTSSYLIIIHQVRNGQSHGEQRCDLILLDVIPTVRRNQIIDLTTYWIYGELAFLIPVSDETANINAVWMGLFVSMVCVMVVLYLMQRYKTHHHPANWHNRPQSDTGQSRNSNLIVAKPVKPQRENEYLFVFGNLLSQGIQLNSKRLTLRLVAGVWILAAFVFVQAYTSLLFTYVLTPVNNPLMNSVYDISENSHINVFTTMAGMSDTVLSAIH